MSKLIKVVIIALLTFIMSLFSLAVLADPGNSHGQGSGKGHGKAHKQKMWHGGKAQGKWSNVQTKFSSNDKTAILNYFNTHPFSAKTLPPGIAKNLARGKPLPPGIAKKYLPNDLLKVLPVYPGAEYFLVGRDAVLVNSASGIITDIIANVLR